MKQAGIFKTRGMWFYIRNLPQRVIAPGNGIASDCIQILYDAQHAENILQAKRHSNPVNNHHMIDAQIPDAIEGEIYPLNPEVAVLVNLIKPPEGPLVGIITT